MCFSLSDNIKKPYFLTHDKISVMSRAMCHTAVAQLNASYPAVHPIQVTAQFPLPALKKKKKTAEPTGSFNFGKKKNKNKNYNSKKTSRCFVWTNPLCLSRRA